MATAPATENTVAIPPYIPFPTVSNFIEHLKETAVPTHIDKSMMRNIAGGVHSYLLASLRFLGLTEGKDNAVTAVLEKLVESVGTEGYKGTLATILTSAYADVIGDIDLTRATDKQISDAFGRCKLDGIARERAIRFYLKALSTAGIAYSSHLGQRKPRGTGNGNSQKPRNKVASNAPEPNATNKGSGESTAGKPKPEDTLADGLIEFPIPVGTKGACIRVPENITSKQIPLVRAIFSAVEALAAQNSGDK
jgi:hypothetical protein